MSSDSPTEQDLRLALRSRAPEDLDASRFRERLDLALGGQPVAPLPSDHGEAPLPAGHGEAPLLSLDLPEQHSRRRARRVELGFAVALAACAAAVITVVALLAPGHSERRPAAPAPKPPVPSAIRTMLLPGTIVLGTYAGHGSQTFVVPSRVVPPHFGYSAYGTCAGKGTLSIAQETLYHVCDSSGAFGTGGAVQNGRLVITAAAATSWQITLALAPDIQTNGSVYGPVDEDMSGPNNAVRHSGQGPGTVSFTVETTTPLPGPRYRLRLVCHGTGVSLPDLATPSDRGLQTKTCFAGHEYVWDDVRLVRSIRVAAAPGTTWTIAIDSM
jgi:hypothetical protein